MTAPIAPIGTIGVLGPIAAPVAPAGAGSQQTGAVAPAATGANFASVLADGLDQVAGAQAGADRLAIQAATGTLADPAQYTIAATKAALMTQLATTVQSKAVAAFNTIMGLQA